MSPSRFPHVLVALVVFIAGCAAHRPASVERWRTRLGSKSLRDGERMAYLDLGPREGEVIVLLHGLPTNAYLYHRVAADLAKTGYRVIAPDLVGFGASSKPVASSAYAFGLQADRLLELLDSLGVARFTFVVHDLGGLVGWELLDKQPARVSRLLVLNTTAYADFRPPVQMRMMAGPMGGMMSGMMGGGTMGHSLTATFIKDNTGSPGKVDDALVESFWWPLHEGATRPMHTMATSFARAQAEFPRYQAALRRFSGPALVLWGARDKILRFDSIAKKFGVDLRLPPESVRRIPDAGHFLMIDRPEILVSTIVELMQHAVEDAPVRDGAAPTVAAAPTPTENAPAPGPSIRGALDVSDRITPSTATRDTTHDVRAELRMRGLLGERLGYAVGIDANIGSADGLVYRAAAYPLGIGYAARGTVSVSLTGGVGVQGGPTSSARLELPAAVDIAVQLGPVSALSWGRVAWVRSSSEALQWQAAVGLRWGGAREYFPGAYLGAGPYLAATMAGADGEQSVGLVLGVDFADGH